MDSHRVIKLEKLGVVRIICDVGDSGGVMKEYKKMPKKCHHCKGVFE